MKLRLTALLLFLLLLLSSCGGNENNKPEEGFVKDLGDGSVSFGDELDSLGVYGGYFEEDAADITVQCISGTPDAYKIEDNTLTFTEISELSVYSVSGKFKGNIVIDTGDAYNFDLELNGLSLVCDSTNPIKILSGSEAGIKANKDTVNYVYDMREAIDPNNTLLEPGAIYSEADLEIGGRGELIVISENNNGIQTKKDLQVQNLSLFVSCLDNALKGNDSIEIKDCNTTLIAKAGDGIKTSRSNISAKSKQRGDVTVTGGTHNIYAALSGIDAAHSAILDKSVSVGATHTVLNVYTAKYSNYSYETPAELSDEGIKAREEILLGECTLNVKTVGNAFETDTLEFLENGRKPQGKVSVNGAVLNIFAEANGIDAEGDISVSAGIISIVKAYDGLSGKSLELLGGEISVEPENEGLVSLTEGGTNFGGAAVTVSGKRVDPQASAESAK